ncbi:hypothetical protein AB751O23_AW_00050 [Chlamydiales bacterium SCGC AB-751-O23]|nr:hypothetical protein AB751O23_AW_00050 [Chlamydiales bacterium SCGC AB-751-O23]
MKKKLILILSSLLCLSSSLTANEMVPRPWQLDMKGFHLTDAKSETKPYDENRLSLTSAIMSLMYTQYLNANGSGLIAEAAYSHLNLDWAENPDVATKDFNDALFTFGAFTTEINNWFLLGTARVQVDATSWDFSNNARYRGLLQGRYQYTQDLDLYVGLMFYTNLQKDDVYPIFGFEYQEENAPWKIKMVLPIESHIMYFINHEWSVGVEHRFIQERRRLKNNEGLNSLGDPRRDRGIFDITAQGLELSAKYSPLEGSYAKVFAGMIYSPEYRTYDLEGQNRRLYKFKSGFHFGGTASFTF